MNKTDITITRTDKVDVIYADPCWGYRNVKTGGSHVSGSAQKYPVLTPAEIAALPVREIANPKGAVCFLWATVPLGRDPYDVLDAWGFEFKTEWFWHKIGRLGTGYWTRGAVEKILIGVRGPVPAWRSTIDNWIDPEYPDETADVITSKPAGHSQKPEAVIRRIEQLTLRAERRVELFASSHSAFIANNFEGNSGYPTPWECYGLDLGHDFTDPNFWARMLGLPEQPVLLDPPRVGGKCAACNGVGGGETRMGSPAWECDVCGGTGFVVIDEPQTLADA